jgi:lysophospholipid acyltransferase (LPLAT)-like uncharacterized protein
MRKLRQLITRIPWLDELRTRLLAKVSLAAINFYRHSYPTVRVVSPKALEFLKSGKPCIIAMYHGRMVGIWQLFKDRSKITGLVSHHRDGELLARFGREMGFNVVRGSATYKAVEGALQLVDAARAGQNPCITVDGPKGPIYKVKMGVIRLAEITGLPILPFTFMPRDALTLKTWDRIVGGYWGTPVVFVIGDPVLVPKDCRPDEREQLRSLLERNMHILRELSDTFWNPKDGALAVSGN